MQALQVFQIADAETLEVFVLPVRVKAGGYGSFESPALDFPEDTIDLIKYLIKDKDTTFFARVTGNSLSGIGVFDGDLLLIQKGVFPRDGDTVVVFYFGEFYTKIYKPSYRADQKLDHIRLKSENADYSDIYINEDSDFQLWGVVTFSIHKHR